MNLQDDWGRDPSVQRMRRIFKGMEIVQKKLLDDSNISPFDLRLRKIREKARILFDQAWVLGIRQGIVEHEEDAVSLYTHCLARSFRLEGIEVPREVLPNDERIARLIQKGI